ncbi:lactadherin [Exaiptasia diaphana]|uniref:F5/8 type C domain-containing protein n=1 Tax=Exaiptasia diaphana TaxID=2652724 RepID=A0A913YGI2_EXADI|nr:lactadherin [Exaiptasia diaphana]
MESGKIPDSSITASSQWDSRFYPGNGRINSSYCWGPKQSKVGEWLQVDLGEVCTITGIATQGLSRHPAYVKSYKLQYGNTPINSASPFAEAGKIIIAGISGGNDVVKHTFITSFDARYVRVLPQKWYGEILLRIELYAGC